MNSGMNFFLLYYINIIVLSKISIWYKLFNIHIRIFGSINRDYAKVKLIYFKTH